MVAVIVSMPYAKLCVPDVVKNTNVKVFFANAKNVSVKGNDYRIHFWYMSKDDAISKMKNSVLNKKSGLL